MELKNYETTFILTPVLSEEQYQESVEKFRAILKKQGAEIIHEDKIGAQKLAYPIQRKSTGFYYLIEFRATPDTIATLETEYKRDEKIIRFLTVTLDKHAVAYNEKKRSGAFDNNPEPKQEVA